MSENDDRLDLYDINHNPAKVNIQLSDRIRKLENDLHILIDGNSFPLDNEARGDLRQLYDQLNHYRIAGLF